MLWELRAVRDQKGVEIVLPEHCGFVTYSTLFSGLTTLFTCGGYALGYSLADAEVIDLPYLEGTLPPRTCSQVPDMPNANYYDFAMWDNGDNSVLCCGGSPSSLYQNCYKYSGYKWIDLGDILLHDRIYSSAAQLRDGRYWISGGQRYKLLNDQ